MLRPQPHLSLRDDGANLFRGRQNFSEYGVYLPAAAEPPVVPGALQANFDFLGSDFRTLGWSPEGAVYFSYAVAVTPDSTGFTADAAADSDANGILQIWGYVKPNEVGDRIDGNLGCVVAPLRPTEIAACFAGTSTF